MTRARLTFLLSHLLQAEVDDSGSQAEANQSDRSPALGGKDTGVWEGTQLVLAKHGPRRGWPLPTPQCLPELGE